MSVNMRVIPVPADGDCFFHAFIKGLGLEGLTPQLLRDVVAQKILTDHDLYDDLVKEWIDFDVIRGHNSVTPEMAAHHIRNTKEWSTSTIIHIIACAFNVRVIVFQKINGNYFSETFPSEWKAKPQGRPYKDIYILRRGSHYELLVPVDNKVNPSLSSRRVVGTSRPYLTRRSQRGGGVDEGDDDFHDGGDETEKTYSWLSMTLGVTGFALLVLTI